MLTATHTHRVTAMWWLLIFAATLAAAGALALAAAPVALPATTVSAKDYGARGNGKHDDTDAVLRAISAVARRGGGTVSFPAGEYRVTKVALQSGVSLSGAGQATTWLHGRIVAAGLLTVSRLRLGTAGASFQFATGTHDTIFDCCRFVGGGGMSSGADQGVIRLDAHSTHDVTFSSCTVGRNSSNGNGISISETTWGHYESILFSRCRIYGQPRMGFECIQRGGEGFRAIDLVDCVFSASDSQTISYDGGGYSTVKGCTIRGAGKRPDAPWPHDFEINGSRGMVVTGNTFWSARGSLLNLNGVSSTTAAPGDSVTISDNTFVLGKGVRHSAKAPWVMVGRSGVSVDANSFTLGAGSQGFYVHGPRNAFTDNVIRIVNAADMLVFLLEGAPGTVTSGNTIL
jgi:hypothetical protein